MTIVLRVAISLLAILLCTTACTIRHSVEDDYPQYLRNNAGQSNLPQTNAASNYLLTPRTQQHEYYFRSWLTGYANEWSIEFGEILDDTMRSEDVQKAFGELQRMSGDSDSSPGLLIFDLENFTFEDFGAHIALNVRFSQYGTTEFSRTYEEDGKTQGGKMFWAGAFGQKNAVQQSTKLAVDEILRQLISDLNAAARNTPVSAPGVVTSPATGTTKLRAVTENAKDQCTLVKTITKGAGGTGDPSANAERVLKLALQEAAGLGADSYFVVSATSNASGANVILEALSCR
jgi:hypothetical protein